MNAARSAGAVCSAVDDVLTTKENRVFCGKAAWASRGNWISHGLLFAQQCHWRITRCSNLNRAGSHC